MNGNTVNDWLDAARHDVAQRAPDAMVETQLLARVRERSALRSVAMLAPARKARQITPWWIRLLVGLPVAIAAVLVVLLGTRPLAPAAPSVPEGEVATPFIALVGSEALAAERAPVVVSSQVARTALADYGLPVDPARVDEPVGAEFLVSRTGIVLAVRFME
jgi:hypothetical protein